MISVAMVGDVHLTDSVPKSRRDADYLDTLLRKLESIYAENDIVVFMGDLFDKPIVNFSMMSRIALFFLGKKGRSFSIIGNHDVPNLNPDNLRRTALGLLGDLGLVEIINSSCKAVENLRLYAIPFRPEVVVPKPEVSDGVVNILLGHCFFENEMDDKYSLFRNTPGLPDYDFVFLGHDHAVYPDTKVGNTSVVRLGSICRNTSHEYQLTKKPSYMKIVVDSGTVSMSRVVVPHLPGPEVFHTDVLSQKRCNSDPVVSIGSLLGKFAMWSDTHLGARITMRSVLKQMGAREEVVTYISKKYEETGMSLK